MNHMKVEQSQSVSGVSNTRAFEVPLKASDLHWPFREISRTCPAHRKSSEAWIQAHAQIEEGAHAFLIHEHFAIAELMRISEKVTIEKVNSGEISPEFVANQRSKWIATATMAISDLGQRAIKTQLQALQVLTSTLSKPET